MWLEPLATRPKIRDESVLTRTNLATNDVAIDARRTELENDYIILYYTCAINEPNDVQQ